MNLIQYYIVEHTEERKRRDLVVSLTGPLLTDEGRLQKIAQRAPDEPPMPDWWVDDDEDASASSIMAARQLGMG